MFFHSTAKATEALAAAAVADAKAVAAQADATTAIAAAAAALALAQTKHTLVNRPQFTSHDFTFDNFTKDAAWHELALASIIPAGTVGVVVVGDVQHSAEGKTFSVRKAGVTNDSTTQGVKTVAAAKLHRFSFYVGVSSDRKIEYYLASTASWQSISLSVIAWVV